MTDEMIPAGWRELLEALEDRRTWAYGAGGQRRIDREHRHGRFTARERINRLADTGTFEEFGVFATTPSAEGHKPSSFLCGLARVDGRLVAIGAEDFTVEGGGVGGHLNKVKGGWGGFIEEIAYVYKIPLVLLIQGVGGTIAIQEEKGYPELVSNMGLFPVFELLTTVPVVAAVMGPTAGSSAARAGLAHFSVMTRDQACLFAGGPPLVKQALGLDIDKLELGGSHIHTYQSGLIDNEAENEDDALAQIRLFLDYLPTNVHELPPSRETDDEATRRCDALLEIVSTDPRSPYDARELVTEVLDAQSFFEIGENFGTSIVTGLGRIGGLPVAVIASDPMQKAGALDGPSSDKQARFVEMCNTFHLPIAYFVDVPGFMIGPEAEKSGVMRRGIRALHAIHTASVPVYTIQVRRSYGLAGGATGNRHPQSVHLAWPSGLWGDLPLEAGLEASHAAEIEQAKDPEALRARLMEEYQAQNSPWRTVERFGVEDMIDPRETRSQLFSLLELSRYSLIPGPKTGPSYRP